MKLIFKYIITDSGTNLFNEQTIYAIVGEGFRTLSLPIYSAGFVEIVFGEKHRAQGVKIQSIKCFGESTSLKIKSHDIDELIIRDLYKEVSSLKYFGNTIAGCSIKQLYKNKKFLARFLRHSEEINN